LDSFGLGFWVWILVEDLESTFGSYSLTITVDS